MVEKKKIKAALEALPFGMGANFIIPMLRWGRYAFGERGLINDIRRKRSVGNEASKVRAAIRNGAKHAIIVYDNLVSPPTYGDYLWILLLARYFQASGVCVSFYIVDSEYRKDWEALTDTRIRSFVQEQVRLAEALLNSNAATIRRISWTSLQAQSLTASADTIVPLSSSIQNRVSAYGDYLILLNCLLYGADKRMLEEVLFSYEQLHSCVELKPLQSPYVTWHCRRSELWAIDRNASDHDVLQIYFLLRQRFAGHAIMVVSDDKGCRYLRNLARAHGLDLLFSRDYSATFLGDGALILGSDFFFQFLGGGIGVFPLCSKVPYEVCSPLDRKFMWSARKAFSWQTEQQVFVNSYSLPHFLRKVSKGSGSTYAVKPEAKALCG